MTKVIRFTALCFVLATLFSAHSMDAWGRHRNHYRTTDQHTINQLGERLAGDLWKKEGLRAYLTINFLSKNPEENKEAFVTQALRLFAASNPWNREGFENILKPLQEIPEGLREECVTATLDIVAHHPHQPWERPMWSPKYTGEVLQSLRDVQAGTHMSCVATMRKYLEKIPPCQHTGHEDTGILYPKYLKVLSTVKNGQYDLFLEKTAALAASGRWCTRDFPSVIEPFAWVEPKNIDLCIRALNSQMIPIHNKFREVPYCEITVYLETFTQEAQDVYLACLKRLSDQMAPLDVYGPFKKILVELTQIPVEEAPHLTDLVIYFSKQLSESKSLSYSTLLSDFLQIPASERTDCSNAVLQLAKGKNWGGQSFETLLKSLSLIPHEQRQSHVDRVMEIGKTHTWSQDDYAVVLRASVEFAVSDLFAYCIKNMPNEFTHVERVLKHLIFIPEHWRMRALDYLPDVLPDEFSYKFWVQSVVIAMKHQTELPDLLRHWERLLVSPDPKKSAGVYKILAALPKRTELHKIPIFEAAREVWKKYQEEQGKPVSTEK